ncbi:hypothetical protein ACIPUD_34550 [Bradyrhizobium sp. CAR08]
MIVMTDFRRSDLIDVFAVEGLCYEYCASAAMRCIGKGSMIKWDAALGSHRYKDSSVNALSFELHDKRNAESFGFRTRLGTWLDEENAGETEAERGDTIKFAQLKPNPKTEEYPAWNSIVGRIGRGYGATNFEIGTFSLAQFRKENAFMGEPFRLKYGINFDAVLFVIWAAAFFGTYVGITMHNSTWAQRHNRTMSNFSNLMFRGYTMVSFDLDEFASEAVWFAKQLGHEKAFAIEEVRKAVEFISLSEEAQKTIGLWSGGKPSVFDKRKKFILEKVDQARSLADRIAKEPKGTNFDVSWAKSIEWRVLSPFVEFAWLIDEPLYDEAGMPRVLQVQELLDHLTDGRVPTEGLVPLIKELRGVEFQGNWY